jgi:hypothetical protein
VDDTGFPGEMEEGHLRRRRNPSYPFENAKHWRLRAEAMRTLGEDADDPTVRAMMLRIAAVTAASSSSGRSIVDMARYSPRRRRLGKRNHVIDGIDYALDEGCELLEGRALLGSIFVPVIGALDSWPPMAEA